MSLVNKALSSELLEKYPFLRLLQPMGGVVGSLNEFFPTDFSAPSFIQVLAGVGNPTGAFPKLLDFAGNDLNVSSIGGGGSDEFEELAIVRAVAEAAERYATCVTSEQDIIVASANELGVDALKFSHLAKCSEKEYADPKCLLRPFNPDLPIRWVKGISLLSKNTVYVPLVMTHLYLREWENERIWNPISTGVAAHVDLHHACISAINEVIERDALSLTWLLRLQLPRIILDESPPLYASSKIERSVNGRCQTLFFDATPVDLKIPTVYALQLTGGHEKVSQFVNCSTHFSMWENCSKLVRESANGRVAISAVGNIPNDVCDFVALEHGAAYMGRPEQREAFDFLKNSPFSRPISSYKQIVENDVSAQLRFLRQRFKELGMEVVLVDLTTDELRECGLYVVRAVIPGLLPMSCVYRSRYLGHPRIYEYSKLTDAGVFSPDDVNPYPQPFA